MKRQLLMLACCMAWGWSAAQVPYGYAPADASEADLSALGGGKNEFVQGLTLFDPSQDAALARMKGLAVRGVRCCLHADYRQARQKRSGILAAIGSPENIVRTTYADLVAGWNDVLFDEPIVIGDDPIYLGVQVYETIGSPYPLMAYSRASVPQSCWINLGKKKWENFTDRGTMLVAALLDDEAAAMAEHTAYALNTTHPQTVAPSAYFEGELYVHNASGTTPLVSIELAMLGEGDDVPTLSSLTFTDPIPPLGGTVVSTRLKSGSGESTEATWQATVTRFNDVEAQAGRPGISRLYVTRDNFLRTPLVEEFTGLSCINCPQMSYFLEKAFQQYDGPYVYVAHHSGFAEDGFTTQPDREALYLFGGYENEYNPAIMYNRAVLEGENTVVQGIRDMSATPYLEALAEAAAMPAMAEVNITEGENGVEVSGRVAGDLVDAPLRLSCYLVEDGISAQRYPQKGLTGDADAPADLLDVFRHNGVILHCYCSDAAGDVLQVSADGTYRVSYPAVSKAGYGGTAQRIVAFVHRLDREHLRENAVLNAAQLYVGASGVSGVRAASIEAPTYDLSGRRVERPFRPGIYLSSGTKKVIR